MQTSAFSTDRAFHAGIITYDEWMESMPRTQKMSVPGLGLSVARGCPLIVKEPGHHHSLYDPIPDQGTCRQPSCGRCVWGGCGYMVMLLYGHGYGCSWFFSRRTLFERRLKTHSFKELCPIWISHTTCPASCATRQPPPLTVWHPGCSYTPAVFVALMIATRASSEPPNPAQIPQQLESWSS